MEKVTLFKEDGSTIVCDLKKPTMAVKDEVLNLSLAALTEQKEIEKDYPGFADIRSKMVKSQTQNNMQDMIEIIDMMNDVDLAIGFTKYTSKIEKLNDHTSILKLQIFAITEKLSDEDKELFNSLPSSDFWKNQDMSEVNAVNKFFREIHRIG